MSGREPSMDLNNDVGIGRRAMIKRAAAAGAVAWTAPAIIESFSSPAAAATAPIAITSLGKDSQTADSSVSSSYTTPNFSAPTKDAPLLILVGGSSDSTAQTISGITGTLLNGSATEITAVSPYLYFSRAANRNYYLYAFKAAANAAGTAGALTIAFSPTGKQKNLAVNVLQLGGNVTLASAIGATKKFTTGSGTTAVTSLTPQGSGSAEVLLLAGVLANDATNSWTHSAFTELEDFFISDGSDRSYSFETSWKLIPPASDTATNSPGSTDAWSGIGIEIKHA